MEAQKFAEGFIGDEAGLHVSQEGGDKEVELHGPGLEGHKDKGEDGHAVREGDHQTALELGGAHFATALWEG